MNAIKYVLIASPIFGSKLLDFAPLFVFNLVFYFNLFFFPNTKASPLCFVVSR